MALFPLLHAGPAAQTPQAFLTLLGLGIFVFVAAAVVSHFQR
jgi:hypothetical protein